MFIITKIIYLFIIIVVCFIGGIATLLLKKFCNTSKNIISYSSCLGGGILLGASFLHLLKDSEEFLVGEYPYSQLIYAFGFFTSFILERVLFEHSHSHEIIIPKSLTTVTVSSNDEENEELIMNEFEMEEKDQDVNSIGDDPSHSNDHSHNIGSDKISTASKIGKFPYMLFTVLSLESFISGMALTIEEDLILISVTFIAIVTHIWAESFALSANIIKSLSVSNDNSYITKKVIISSIVFSFITPIGGIFGLISEYILNQNQIDQISGILLAFAGGCFLYVSIFEIMVEEFSSQTHGHSHNSDNGDNINNNSSKSIITIKLIKLFLLLSGFAFMALIANYV